MKEMELFYKATHNFFGERYLSYIYYVNLTKFLLPAPIPVSLVILFNRSIMCPLL